MVATNRRPPMSVRRELRREVTFCCPVRDCNRPYLTWHHFDPPWRTEHHHRPEGMIALCREHADNADSGAFTDEQLREFKFLGRNRVQAVHGRLEWMRRDLLAVVGSNYFVEPQTILAIAGRRCIWFNRDADGYLLICFRMPTLSGRPRASIMNNYWTTAPDLSELICPPGGRSIDIRYRNGDHFHVQFLDVNSVDELSRRYWPVQPDAVEKLRFPLTVAELSETAAGTALEFGPKKTLVGNLTFEHSTFVGVDVAYSVLATKDETRMIFSGGNLLPDQPHFPPPRVAVQLESLF